jgi:MFS transporter, PAT family, beta-lactamase induction signal transducer AmpG
MSNPQRRPLAVYFERQNLTMLALGFSSGLPFMLVANTLGYWLRDEGTSLQAIGFITWVGFAYTFKFLWAPIIDRTSVPVLARLGRRRSWMILMQVFIALGLAAMGTVGLSHGLVTLGILALVVAFSSATQDVTVDAWRIETARGPEELGVMTSSYTFGYRAALLASEAIILLVASRIGWNSSYLIYGTLMVVGLAACLMAAEPVGREKPSAPVLVKGSLNGLLDSIVNPFVTFFQAHGANAALMLLAISLFQIPNFVMGPMTNPLYHDIGLTKDTVGAVRGTFGLVAVFAGVAAGGFLVVKLGRIGALLVGGSAQILGTIAYAILPFTHDPVVFAAVMAADNFGIAMAGVTLVTYMSSLTTIGYTATQYALLSSAYTVFGKLLKGFSGTVVEGLAAHVGLMEAYALFFIGAGLIGIPALLLFVLLASQRRQGPA